MKNVVFDLGGVLLRWRPAEFIGRLLPHRAASVEAAAALAADFFQGFGGDWADFDRGSVAPPALAARIAARIGIGIADARTVIDAVPAELLPLPESVALLRRLHERGHALFYLSNMPAPYAAILQATPGLLDVFRDGVFSSRIGVVKPEPAIYAHAIRAFGIVPADTLFIDDMQANVDAARAAGWHGLRFRDAAQCEAALAALGLF